MSRWPLVVQVIAVLGLLIASLCVLWRTGASIVEREARRTTALETLRTLDDALARKGAAGLVFIPQWPDTLGAEEWASLDAWLARQGEATIQGAQALDLQAGFYVADDERYLGTVRSTDGPRPKAPPQRELELIDAQVHAALDRERSLEIVVDRPTGMMALRTGPVWVNGRKVAATWTLGRVEQPGALDDVMSGYRLAVGLALGGVVMALGLSVHLGLTIRRQAVERVRMQAELRRGERLAALGKLLAGVAHEVRNPLAGIRSTAQLWQRGFGPDEESVRDLVSEVDRLDAIVSRLLEFSRAEARDRAPSDLNAVVADAARLSKPLAGESAVQVSLDLEPSLPEVSLAPRAVLQVLRNLTTNAIQAMPNGGALHLATGWDPITRQARVRVEDNGPGLSAEARAHLFEPFHTTKPDGTGLGLAIAREIALGHGGDLEAGPANGHSGAVFTLTLPLDGPSGRYRNAATETRAF